ncbi:MAG: T9SS type A sorting domain-containing protein [Bacteroidota bacterium]
MRKSVHKFFLVLVTLLSVFTLKAQDNTCEQLEVISDQSVTFNILSLIEPIPGVFPDFGDVSSEQVAPFSWDVTYTPDPGVGADDGADDLFSLITFTLDGDFTTDFYCVDIEAAIIRAEHDIALTLEGLPVFVDVVNNDFSSLGYFDLESVSVSNNGTTEIVGDNILFTPAPGFIGLTDFDYVICVMGVCDLGTVSINVLPGDQTFPTDTVRLFSKRDGEAFIFVPEDYTLVDSDPAPHGEYDDQSGEVPVYIADGQFVGEDYLVFENSLGNQITFEVTVLDLIDNAFAVEDQYNTTVDGNILLTPLYNDLYGNLGECVSFGLPLYGTLEPTSDPSQMIYQPPTGWRGIDRVDYISYPPGSDSESGCDGEPETQSIYILVSNFEPEDDEVELTVSASSQVAITYEVPIAASAEWSVVSPPQAGMIEEIGGQLFYTAPDQATSDQLTINYCLLADNGVDCEASKEVLVNIVVNSAALEACNEDCVWPGDANADGVVDLGDMLTLGRYMGTYGNARDGDPLIWCPQNSVDWGESTASGVDLKHVDTDGNRFIDHRDTALIRQHLGLAHQIRPSRPMLESFDVNLVGDIFAEPGEIVELDIVIGPTISDYIGTEDLVGFRLPFDYDPEFIDATSISVDFLDQAWVSYDSPVISMTTNDEEEGQFEAVYSRTNGSPTSGLGSVGTMYIGTEDLVGFRPGDDPITVTIGGGEATVMTGAGFLGSVNIQPFELTIVPRPEVDEDLSQEEIQAELIEDLLAYPNPTSGALNVHLNSGRQFTDLDITDLHGRVVQSHNSLETNHLVIDLSGLANGIYSLRVTTPDGVVTRKLEVLR